MIVEEAEAFALALPRPAALMGLDLGTKTIGVAVCDPMQTVATPLKTLKRVKFTQDAQALEALVAERGIKGLVLGLPRNMDGSEGPRAQSTRAFARNLSARLPLPIMLWDERLSTVAAEVIDHVAAGLILQGFLDRLRHLETQS